MLPPPLLPHIESIESAEETAATESHEELVSETQDSDCSDILEESGDFLVVGAIAAGVGVSVKNVEDIKATWRAVCLSSAVMTVPLTSLLAS
jgi:hypothetical protein